jgi:hypothetical protein
VKGEREMKQVKEFSIKLTEGDSCPIVKIDGEEVSYISKLKFYFDSKNTINDPWENGFLIEFFDIEDGKASKKTIGQSFRA